MFYGEYENVTSNKVRGFQNPYFPLIILYKPLYCSCLFQFVLKVKCEIIVILDLNKNNTLHISK